uniref:hypothetical protein n=1 Tax=Halorubrum halophilum TaxID=413816 RepID=UPI000AD00B9A|nr:hypothetical protein [Halorubrum halophilum]
MSQATLGSGPYRNSSLFSGYYLDERVADLDAWDCDEEAEEAFEQIRDLWNQEGALLPSYKEDELIDTWIAEVLDILGYGTSSEVTLPDGGGYVDRLLFENADTRRESAKQALDSGTGGALLPGAVDPRSQAVGRRLREVLLRTAVVSRRVSPDQVLPRTDSRRSELGDPH